MRRKNSKHAAFAAALLAVFILLPSLPASAWGFTTARCDSFGDYVLITDDRRNDLPDSTPIVMNREYVVEFEEGVDCRYYRYKPSVTGFYSFRNTFRSYGYLEADVCNYEGGFIAGARANTYDPLIEINVFLRAGYTYYFRLMPADPAEGGRFGFELVKATRPYDNWLVTHISGESWEIGISNNMGYELTQLTGTGTEWVFFSSSDPSLNPVIWVFDSNLNQVAFCGNSDGTSDFRLKILLASGVGYWIVAALAPGQSGSYRMDYLKERSVTSSTAEIFSFTTGLRLGVYRSLARTEVMGVNGILASFCATDWVINRNSDGSYYIYHDFRSGRMYVGISASSSGGISLALYPAPSDSTKWKFYAVNCYNPGAPTASYLAIVPVSEPGYMLYCPGGGSGTLLALRKIVGSCDDHSTWWGLR